MKPGVGGGDEEAPLLRTQPSAGREGREPASELVRLDEALAHCLAPPSARRREAFPNDVRPALQLLANQVAVALENTRLFEQTRQRVAELETLNQVSQVIASQLDLNTLIQRIGEITCQIFDEHTGYIALYDPQSRLASFPFFVYQGQPRQVEYRC